MTRIILFLSALTCMTLLATPSQASLLANGSFELGSDGLNPGGWYGKYTSLAGWDTDGWIEVEYNTIVVAQHGNKYVELDSYFNSNIKQIVQTDVGAEYELKFYYQARVNDNAQLSTNAISVNVGNDYFVVDKPYAASKTDWHEISHSFVATSTTTGLEFAAIGKSDSFGGFLDNVSLTKLSGPAAGVPELSASEGGAAAAILIGGAAILGTPRRRAA